MPPGPLLQGNKQPSKAERMVGCLNKQQEMITKVGVFLCPLHQELEFGVKSLVFDIYLVTFNIPSIIHDQQEDIGKCKLSHVETTQS